MEPTRKAADERSDAAPAIPERYEEIVQRLGQLVDRLEGGGLSLEDAIAAFEQGIRLAQAGSARLDAAERRVEVLLEGDRTEPFETGRPDAPPPMRGTQAPGSRPRRVGGEDIPS